VLQPLPGAFRRQLEAEDREKVARIVREFVRLEVDSVAGATAGGARRVSGAFQPWARGCSGAIRGTSPIAELLRRESRG